MVFSDKLDRTYIHIRAMIIYLQSVSASAIWVAMPVIYLRAYISRGLWARLKKRRPSTHSAEKALGLHKAQITYDKARGWTDIITIPEKLLTDQLLIFDNELTNILLIAPLRLTIGLADASALLSWLQLDSSCTGVKIYPSLCSVEKR